MGRLQFAEGSETGALATVGASWLPSPLNNQSAPLLTLNFRALHSSCSGQCRLVGERSRVERGDVGVTVEIPALLAMEVGVMNDGDGNLRRNKV